VTASDYGAYSKVSNTSSKSSASKNKGHSDEHRWEIGTYREKTAENKQNKPVGDVIMRAALCHHYDVIRSSDVIGHMTIRLSIDDFLYV